MVKDHKYTMLWEKEEKDRLTEWGKGQGFTSLAKLIEMSLEIVQRNPKLLQITENPTDSLQLLEELKEVGFGTSEEITYKLNSHSEKLAIIDRQLEWIMTKLGASSKDIKKVRKKDLSGEVIFE